MFFTLTSLALAALIAGAGGLVTIPSPYQLVGRSVTRVKTTNKIVALTFDDGPNPAATNKILKVLKKHNVKATFFIVGKHANKYPDLVRNVYKNGHEIGNHSWNHTVLICKSSEYIKNQIEKTDKLIRNLGYTKTIHFRPPKGLRFYALPKILKEKNKPNILFDVVAWDWTCPGTKKIVKNVVKNTKPGSIILLHDGDGDRDENFKDRSQTVAATDIIIKKLKKKGYKFVTISELLN